MKSFHCKPISPLISPPTKTFPDIVKPRSPQINHIAKNPFRQTLQPTTARGPILKNLDSGKGTHCKFDNTCNKKELSSINKAISANSLELTEEKNPKLRRRINSYTNPDEITLRRVREIIQARIENEISNETDTILEVPICAEEVQQNNNTVNSEWAMSY